MVEVGVCVGAGVDGLCLDHSCCSFQDILVAGPARAVRGQADLPCWPRGLSLSGSQPPPPWEHVMRLFQKHFTQ